MGYLVGGVPAAKGEFIWDYSEILLQFIGVGGFSLGIETTEGVVWMYLCRPWGLIEVHILYPLHSLLHFALSLFFRLISFFVFCFNAKLFCQNGAVAPVPSTSVFLCSISLPLFLIYLKTLVCRVFSLPTTTLSKQLFLSRFVPPQPHTSKHPKQTSANNLNTISFDR